MISTYFTWRALAAEINRVLSGRRIEEVYSQSRDELIFSFVGDDSLAFRVSIAGQLRFAHSTVSHRKARKNVAGLFHEVTNLVVTEVSCAFRDRLMTVQMESGLEMRILPYGPRPNILLADATGTVLRAFKGEHEWKGKSASEARPAPVVDSFEILAKRWRSDVKDVQHAINRAFPLFDVVLAAELAQRADLENRVPGNCTEEDLGRLLHEKAVLETELLNPQAQIYRSESGSVFSLISLESRAGDTQEIFASVSEAISVFVRERHIGNAFDERFEVLHRKLKTGAARLQKRADDMSKTLKRPARADKYEQWGHLLMTHAHTIDRGEEHVTVSNILSSGEPVEIPLDPALSPIENAQTLYERARRSREAHSHAERRLGVAVAEAETAAGLLAELELVHTLRELDVFERRTSDRRKSLDHSGRTGTSKVPFRAYIVAGGLEVWVGRNAKQNDLLTLRHARKFDIWMHARGVPGSHVVLRLPGSSYQVGREAIEQAAAIAAWWSDARTSSVAPVIVVERKYVRKPRGATPGTVRVEREEVVMVEPHLPAT